MKTLTFCLLLTGIVCAQVRISSGVAAGNLADKVEPVYPAIARAARIQGIVVLEIDIAADGSVSAARVVSGPPMLAQAAIDAVKQWNYRPYKLNGEPSAVKTTVSVPFSLGIPDGDYQKHLQSSDRYFQLQDKCRAEIKSGNFSDAQNKCTEAVKTVEELPEDRHMERIEAYGLVGQAYFYDKKVAEALPYFQREVEYAEKYLHGYNAETAYAYRHLAWAFHAGNRSEEALVYYSRAEKTLQMAKANIHSAFLKNDYTKTLKATLGEHTVLLRQLGKAGEADQLAREADTLVIKTGVNPDE